MHGTLHTRQAQVIGKGGEGGQGGCSHHGIIRRNLHKGSQAHIPTHAASAQLTTRSVAGKEGEHAHVVCGRVRKSAHPATQLRQALGDAASLIRGLPARLSDGRLASRQLGEALGLGL